MSWDEVERELVTELRVLETFRREHVSRYPGARVDRDDPDVQRIIEAVALSAIRTRLSLQSNLHRMWQRLCGSYFEFLMTPLPSCGIVQATVTPRLVETQTIPRGTQLVLSGNTGDSATYTTLDELRILPIQLESVDFQARDAKRWIELRFASRFPRTDAVGLVRLHLRCAAHYPSAVNIAYQLRGHLQRAVVQYGQAGAVSEALPCPVSFGARAEEPLDGDPINPQDAVRRFFHFPERELYLNVEVPQSPRPWQTFMLRLEVDHEYPPDQVPGLDTFQLFTVPVENRARLPAMQLVLDGTRSSHPIMHLDPGQRFSLLRVRGVYRRGEQGLVPLRASSVVEADSPDCYELEAGPAGDAASHRLLVRDPAALLQEVKLHVDCEWHQPWFAEQAQGSLRASVPYRSLDGITLDVLGGVTRSSSGTLGRNTQGLLQFLSLRMKPVLGLDELRRVLDALGTVSASPYRRLPQRLRRVRVEPALDSALRGSGLRHLYHVTIDPFDAEEEPLVWHFLNEITRLLDSWNAEASVELVVDAGESSFTVPLLGANK